MRITELPLKGAYTIDLEIQEDNRGFFARFYCKEEFEKKGLIFSALSPDGMLPEIIELKDHPWFVGVQFHPEFKSRPFTPHPLFSSFVKAAQINKGRN